MKSLAFAFSLFIALAFSAEAADVGAVKANETVTSTKAEPQTDIKEQPEKTTSKANTIASAMGDGKTGPLSGPELYVSGRAPTEVSLDIRQFGYELFSQPPTTFAPVEKIPVGPDYVIGPGDEIKVAVWGKVEGQWSVAVDRDGNISLPKAGVMGVTGLSFGELKELLSKEFSKYYTGFEMNVSMGALRSIRVYVVGNAARPGAYTVSSLSTLINALFEAGGPSRVGTMRAIELKRGGSLVVTFDMYDFLLKGDKTKDMRLMPEDVIFIPPVGPLAAIAGSVKSPAIYELRDETSITGLIAMAGGPTAAGYMERVQAERVFNNEAKVVVDSNLKNLKKEDDIVLRDGDIVKVSQIQNVVINAVALEGNVSRPGRYQWAEGMRVTDIIKDPEKDLLPETYFEHALLERSVPPDQHREIISLNLRRAVFDKDPAHDLKLEPYDRLVVYSKWEFGERPRARVSGAVSRPDYYDLSPNMKVSDLVKLSGGLKRYALPEEAELTRLGVTDGGPATERVHIDLKKAMAGDPAHDLALMENDYLLVRTVPEWALYRTVAVKGEVRFPGTYAIEKGEKLSSLIERAGGFTDGAYLRGAEFTRQRVKELQQERIDEMVERLDGELLSTEVSQTGTASTTDEAKLLQMEAEQKRRLVSKMRAARAKGRVALELSGPEGLKGTAYDIELEEGDALYVPSDPKTVQVVGSVYTQTAFVHENGQGYRHYVELAGGYSRNADKDGVYILRADGTAARAGRVESGDTVVVPEKLERIAWMRNVKDITQILYQIAVTAGVLIVAF